MANVFVNFLSVLVCIFLQTICFMSNVICFCYVLQVVLNRGRSLGSGTWGSEVAGKLSFWLVATYTPKNNIIFSGFYLQVVANNFCYIFTSSSLNPLSRERHMR